MWNHGITLGILLAFIFGLPGDRATRDFPRVTVVGDTEYVTLNHLARHYGFPRPRPQERRVVLENDQHRLVLDRDARRAELNGVTVWLHRPVEPHRRTWRLTAADVRTVLDPVLRPARHLQEAGYQVIVLDAGHGGRDEGGRGVMGTLEKDMTLIITHKVAALLEQGGHHVYLTRQDDRYLSLEERVRMTDEVGGDLFVSIHFNTAGNAEARGTETFVLSAGGMPSTSDREQSSYPPATPAN